MSEDDDKAEQLAQECQELVKQIRPMLAGRDRRVQSSVLADLLSIWLAGHFAGSAEANEALREELLEAHLALVRDLIEPNEEMILEQARAAAQKENGGNDPAAS